MNKNRLEAFSDGVFAIVITLLILDIHIPKVDYEKLPDALLTILPKILTYTYSFIIIGLYWVSHHNISRMMQKVDRVVVWLNILLLLFVGFIPFPTSLMGEYPLQKLPIVLYGSTLLISNLIGFIMWRYICVNDHLLDPKTTPAAKRATNKSFLFVNVFYIIAMAISAVHTTLSYIIFAAVPLYIMLFGRTDRVKTS